MVPYNWWLWAKNILYVRITFHEYFQHLNAHTIRSDFQVRFLLHDTGKDKSS